MTQITDLPQAQTPLSPGDIVMVVQNGNARQVAQAQLGTQEAITPDDLPIATTNLVGAVKVDGSSITVTTDGTISSHSSVTGSTITGTPVTGNLTQFSGASTISNGDLTGDVTTSGGLATTIHKISGVTVSSTTGTTNLVFSNSPTLVTPNLGTPSSVVLTNATGTAASLTAGMVTTIPILTGDIQNTANATTVEAIQGNFVAGTTGTGNVVFDTSPTLITPVLGQPQQIDLTNATGDATGAKVGGLSDGTANTLAGFGSSGVYQEITVSTGLDLIDGVLTASSSSPTFDELQSGTNTTAAMIVGTGSSLGVTGTGVITATTLATARAIGGIDFDGSAAITPQQIQPASENSDTTCFLAFFNAASGTAQQPKYNASLAYNASTNALTATSFIGALTGNASTVTTNANLSGVVTSSGNTTSFGTFTSSTLASALSDETGSGSAVFATSPTLVTPNLGTPSAVVLTNATGTAASLTAGTATALSNKTANSLAGFNSSGVYADVTVSTGLSLSAGVLTATGSSPAFSSVTSGTNTTAAMLVGTGASLAATGSGTITATATPAAGITGTTLASGVTASSLTSFGSAIALGTPASGVLTNCTGTASGLTAGTVTTNANLTGPITSVGNATTITSSIALPGSPTTTTQTALTSNTTIATTAYCDSAVTAAVNGLDWKQACTTATTASLVGTYLSGVFTMTATGVLTIDGQTATLNNTYLFKNQTTGTQNGAYTCTTAGSVGVASVFTRRSDYNTTAKIQSGDTFFIQEGTVNGGTAWSLTTPPPITLDTTSLTFSQVSGPGTYTAGTGLTLTGTAFSVNSSQSIATLSNLASNGIVTTSGGVGTLGVTATTGSGSVVLATSPTLVTPLLGTPTSGTLTNCSGYSANSLAGTALASGVTASSLTSVGTLTSVATSGAINSSIAQTTLSGTTAGSVVWSMPFQGSSNKMFNGHASAYENNSVTSQTITFTTAFTNTPTIIANDTGLILTATTTTLTITAPNSATTFTGNIIIMGY